MSKGLSLGQNLGQALGEETEAQWSKSSFKGTQRVSTDARINSRIFAFFHENFCSVKTGQK